MKNSGGKWIIVIIVLVILYIVGSSNSDYVPIGHSGYSSRSYSDERPPCPPRNTTPAMSADTARRLSGTGYQGCKPNSSAEISALSAAQVKCKNCGYHSDNGLNSYCDYCAWMERYGGGLPAQNSQPTAASSTTPRESTKATVSDDPYEAGSYGHPDDFYYDHYDDFWDYEEAEEYWNDHQ